LTYTLWPTQAILGRGQTTALPGHTAILPGQTTILPGQTTILPGRATPTASLDNTITHMSLTHHTQPIMPTVPAWQKPWLWSKPVGPADLSRLSQSPSRPLKGSYRGPHPSTAGTSPLAASLKALELDTTWAVAAAPTAAVSGSSSTSTSSSKRRQQQQHQHAPHSEPMPALPEQQALTISSMRKGIHTDNGGMMATSCHLMLPADMCTVPKSPRDSWNSLPAAETVRQPSRRQSQAFTGFNHMDHQPLSTLHSHSCS
jgi:hypothetical protein